MDKNQEMRIHCKVENCVYHKAGEMCTAPHINVGPQHACSSQDTVCSTFKPETGNNNNNCCR